MTTSVTATNSARMGMVSRVITEQPTQSPKHDPRQPARTDASDDFLGEKLSSSDLLGRGRFPQCSADLGKQLFFRIADLLTTEFQKSTLASGVRDIFGQRVRPLAVLLRFLRTCLPGEQSSDCLAILNGQSADLLTAVHALLLETGQTPIAELLHLIDGLLPIGARIRYQLLQKGIVWEALHAFHHRAGGSEEFLSCTEKAAAACTRYG